MSHAAFSGWAGVRTSVCLPAMVIAFATTPSSCSSCFNIWPLLDLGDLGDLEVIEAAADWDEAFELNVIERIAVPADAKRLHDFGRDEGSSLARARELVDNAVRQAEADLKQKWPRAELRVRLANVSGVVPFSELDYSNDMDDAQRLDRAYVADFVEQLISRHPDGAATLRDPTKVRADAEKAEKDDEKAPTIDMIIHFRMAYSDKRPDGDFESKEKLERALLKIEPMTMTARMVYEVTGPQYRERIPVEDPVLALEVVTLRFEYDGQQWKAVAEAEPDQDAAEPKAGNH